MTKDITKLNSVNVFPWKNTVNIQKSKNHPKSMMEVTCLTKANMVVKKNKVCVMDIVILKILMVVHVPLPVEVVAVPVLTINKNVVAVVMNLLLPLTITTVTIIMTAIP